MEKFYTDYKGQLRSGNVELFLEIAIDIYSQMVEIQEKIQDLESKVKPEHIDDVVKFVEDRSVYADSVGPLTRKKFKLANQGVIVLATYYEALINEIGIVELGTKYYKENLDKLSVQAKWEVVLKLIYSRTLDKASQEYESLNNIIALRNKLVHYKTTSLNNPKYEDYKEALRNALKRIETFELAIIYLSRFHQNLIEIDSAKNLLKHFNFQNELSRIQPTHKNG
ncbi:hypothetical protein [Salegentibacter sp. F14]